MNAILPRRRYPYLLILIAIIAVGVISSIFPPALLVISMILFIGGLFFVKAPFIVLLFLVIFRVGVDSFARQHYLFSDSAFAVNILGLFNLGLVLLAILYFAIFRRKFPKYPFVIPYIIFLYAIILSFLPSINRMVSFRGWILVASYLAIYVLLVSQLNSEKRLYQLREALILSLLIPVSMAIYQFFTGSGNTAISPGFNRVMGTLFHPSALGNYLLMLWPLVFIQIFRSKKLISRSGYLILASLLVFCIGITFTRVAWFGLLVAWVLILLVLGRFRLILISILFGSIIALVFAEPLLSRIGQAVSFDGGQIVFSQYGSLAWRFLQWQIARDLFVESPIIGVGLGTFRYYNIWGTVPHNEYLRLISEIGFLGLISFIIVMSNVVIWLYIKYRSLPKGSYFAHTLGAVLVSVIAYLILAITDNPVGLPEVSWYLWALLALAVGTVRVSNRSIHNPAK
jgi:O-antigen ligase